jgi:hypothetical protein
MQMNENFFKKSENWITNMMRTIKIKFSVLWVLFCTFITIVIGYIFRLFGILIEITLGILFILLYSILLKLLIFYDDWDED